MKRRFLQELHGLIISFHCYSRENGKSYNKILFAFSISPFYTVRLTDLIILHIITNFVALSPQANYTD
jgi:hypothetical protein